MTDYSHLPNHPRPSSRTYAKPDLSPIALVLVALFVIGAMLYASFYAGRMTAKRIDEAKVDQAFKTGMTLGAICAHDPTMAACSPESLRSGHVL
jgi:hypothetical protein